MEVFIDLQYQPDVLAVIQAGGRCPSMLLPPWHEVRDMDVIVYRTLKYLIRQLATEVGQVVARTSLHDPRVMELLNNFHPEYDSDDSASDDGDSDSMGSDPDGVLQHENPMISGLYLVHHRLQEFHRMWVRGYTDGQLLERLQMRTSSIEFYLDREEEEEDPAR